MDWSDLLPQLQAIRVRDSLHTDPLDWNMYGDAAPGAHLLDLLSVVHQLTAAPANVDQSPEIKKLEDQE
jgi:hypothetical protein